MGQGTHRGLSSLLSPPMRGSPEGLLEAVEVLEEALCLCVGIQGVTPVLQGDTVPGPVAPQPCGTEGWRWVFLGMQAPH